MTEINKDDRIFSGFGSIDITDRQGDRIPILEFKSVMEKLMSSGEGIPINDSHTNHRCGTLLSYDFRKNNRGEDGLYLTAKIFRLQPEDDEIWAAILEGRYTGFSLGGRANFKTPTCDQNGCYNLLQEISVWEFSIVETPANPGALITGFNKLAKSLKFSKDDAKRIGDKLKVDWEKISIDEFVTGINIETEHGKKNPDTNITDDDEILTAKIALAHLLEFPNYYSKSQGLPKLENNLKNPILKYIIYKAKAYVKKPNDAPPGVKVHTGSEGGLYYNTEDNYGNVSSHSKIRLKRPDDAPAGIKVREDEDGFYYNSDDIKKVHVYIKTPSEAPQGSQVHVGPEGGKYYETEEIENRGKREQIERQQKTPKINIKSLQNIIGEEAYNRMDKWKAGRELKDLLNTYSKISTGTANNEEINRNFDLIKRNLHSIYEMYIHEAGVNEKSDNDVLDLYHQSHKIVANKIEKLENEFNYAKNSKDKIIAIDNFINTAHTSGSDIIARIWNARSFLSEDNRYDDEGFAFVSHYVPIYLNYMRENIGKSIQKARVYIKTPSEAPQGVKIEEGARGGHYYESEESEQEASQPQEAVKRNISELNPRVYDNYDALLHFETGQEVLLSYMCDPKKSYNKIEQDIGKSVILNEYKTEIPSGWENSMQVLHNPLVIEWKDWKQRLSQFYNNKTGKKLRNSLIEDGYDSIVTIDGENVSEIVLLKPKIVSYEELKKTEHYDGTDGINDRFKFENVMITVPINDIPTNAHLRILECSESFKFSSLKDKPIIRFLGKSKHDIFKWQDRDGILHESECGGTAAYDDNQIDIYDDFGVDDIVYHEVGHFVYKKMMSSVDVIPDATIKGLTNIDKIEEYNKTIEILRNHNVSMNFETIDKILDNIGYAQSLNILPDLSEAGLHYYDNAYSCMYGIRDRLKMGYIPELSPFEEQQWKKYKKSHKAELKSQILRNEWLNIWQTEGYKDKEYANRNNNETFAEFYQTMHRILSTKNIQLKNDWITATALQHPLKTAFFKKYVIKKWVKGEK